MQLSIRHRAGIKPAVYNLRHAVHNAAALRALDSYSVNFRSVKLDIVGAVIGHALQFIDTAHSV